MDIGRVVDTLPTVEDITKLTALHELLTPAGGATVDLVEAGLGPADFFFVTSFVGSQAKAVDIEKYITELLGLKRVPATSDRGDARNVDGQFYEFKTSTVNFAETLNVRQIRLWQTVDFYICSYINERDLRRSRCYKLTKAQMTQEVDRCGSYTHGTATTNTYNTRNEHSITIPMASSNEHTRRWDARYRYGLLYTELTQPEVSDAR